MDVFVDGKQVYTLGSGNLQLLARESKERAGELAPVYHLPDPTWGMGERLEGYGGALSQQYPIRAGEAIFVISNSGPTPDSLEIEMGQRIFAYI